MTRHNCIRAASVSVTALAIGLIAPPALAQGQAQGQAQATAQAEIDADDAAEIVVTVQRREQSLIDVPLSVQAFSGRALERAGITDLNEGIKLIPGASVVSSVSPGFETYQIRGISSGTVGDATVGYYVDGALFAIPNLQLAPPSNLFDVERVEVLRGPQGTLYGTGALGGLINIVTAAPNPNKWVAKGRFDVSGTEGGGTNYAFDGVLNVPIVSDKIALRITGGYSYLSGFAGTVDDPDANVNDTESYNIRGRLLLRPTDNLDITLSAWRIYANQNYGNNLLSIDPPTEPNAFGTNPFIKTALNMYTGVINWDLDAVRIESSTSYFQHELDFDITANLASGLGIRAIDLFQTDSFSQEVRVLSNGDGPFSWIIGGIYTNATINSQFDVTIVVPTDPPFELPFQSVFDAPLKSESFAFYGEASYALFDGKLTPLFGLRYFHDNRSASGFSTIAGGPVTFDAASATFDTVNPRFNLAYTPNDRGTVYVNIAKGYRSGSIQTAGQVFFAGLQDVATSLIIQPDYLWTYEVGTKWKIGSGGKLLVDAAFYYTNWDNIQIPFVTAAGITAVVNGGAAEIYGFDLGLTWAPVTGLTLQAIANINSSTFSDVNPELAVALPSAQNGNQLPGVPNSNFTLAGAYALPLNETFDLNLYASYSYLAPQSDLASGQDSAALDQITLRAGVSRGAWKFDVYVNNLLNDLGPAVVTTTAVQPLYPRVVGVSLGLSY